MCNPQTFSISTSSGLELHLVEPDFWSFVVEKAPFDGFLRLNIASNQSGKGLVSQQVARADRSYPPLRDRQVNEKSQCHPLFRRPSSFLCSRSQKMRLCAGSLFETMERVYAIVTVQKQRFPYSQTVHLWSSRCRGLVTPCV